MFFFIELIDTACHNWRGAIILLLTECQIKNVYDMVKVSIPANYSLEISESVLMSRNILKTKFLNILRRMRNLKKKRKKVPQRKIGTNKEV